MQCGALQLLSSMMMRGRLPHCTISRLARPVVSSRWSRSLPCRFHDNALLSVALLKKGFIYNFFKQFLASRFGHCGGLSCIFLINHNLFFLAIRLFRILTNCRNRTHSVELENCFKFGLKDTSLAFLNLNKRILKHVQNGTIMLQKQHQ